MGVAAGAATITATSEGVNGTAALTVTVLPPPPSGTWPNEPAGFTLVSDEAFNALTENGWTGGQGQTTNGSGLVLTTDPTAPLSPLYVLQCTYATGFQAGSAPCHEWYNPGSPVAETYVGFWWKPSNPWQSHPSGVNKIMFLFPQTSGAGSMFTMMNDAGGGNYRIVVTTQFPSDNRNLLPNMTATPVTLGQWHRIEWYVKYSTTGSSHDGVVRWWLDGVLQGVYTDLQTPADAGFIEYIFSPTWGGVGGTKTETDYYWFDHAHISRR
jgi:hypothetical protein